MVYDKFGDDLTSLLKMEAIYSSIYIKQFFTLKKAIEFELSENCKLNYTEILAY